MTGTVALTTERTAAAGRLGRLGSCVAGTAFIVGASPGQVAAASQPEPSPGPTVDAALGSEAPGLGKAETESD